MARITKKEKILSTKRKLLFTKNVALFGNKCNF